MVVSVCVSIIIFTRLSSHQSILWCWNIQRTENSSLYRHYLSFAVSSCSDTTPDWQGGGVTEPGPFQKSSTERWTPV